MKSKKILYKENTEENIILDFKSCKYYFDIHKELKEKFKFPDYYGNNWAALWDCMREFFNSKLTIEIYGFGYIEKRFGKDVYKMIDIFNDLQKENYNVKVIIRD